MEFTIDELKLLHAAGVPIQIDIGERWAPLAGPQLTNPASEYRPDPAALVFRSPEGVLTLGHSREDLLAAQAAGWKLQVLPSPRDVWRGSNETAIELKRVAAVYRLAPGQEPWPAPEAKPELPRFAVGQVWERRDGERFVVSKILNGLVWSAENGHVNVYEASGKASSNGPSVADLIRLISEPEAADPWPREKRALAAGLRVQCRCAAVLDMPWHTIGDSTKHLLKGNGGGSWADPNCAFRVDPRDEPAMQAIERGERSKGETLQCNKCRHPIPAHDAACPMCSTPKATPATAAPHEAWLVARPARLAARKPLAVSAARFNAFRDMAGWTSQYMGPVEGMLPRKQKDRFPVHNPDARMATVPGHEKGMP